MNLETAVSLAEVIEDEETSLELLKITENNYEIFIIVLKNLSTIQIVQIFSQLSVDDTAYSKTFQVVLEELKSRKKESPPSTEQKIPAGKSPFDISEYTLQHGCGCDDPECGGDGH